MVKARVVSSSPRVPAVGAGPRPNPCGSVEMGHPVAAGAGTGRGRAIVRPSTYPGCYDTKFERGPGSPTRAAGGLDVTGSRD
jgi:hypothetical protein